MNQWYEKNPDLFEAAKRAMEKICEDSEFGKLDDGRIYWSCCTNTNLENNYPCKYSSYHFLIVCEHYYPQMDLGCPIRVYPVIPDFKEIQECIGFIPFPHNLKKDVFGNKYYDFYCCNGWNTPKGVLVLPTNIYCRMSSIALGIELFKSGQIPKETIMKEV